MRFYFLIFFILVFSDLYSQVNDAAIWSSFGIKKKISEKFTFNLDEQLRFTQNISQLGFINTETGLSYKFQKNFLLSVNYRWINSKQLDNSYLVAHRFFTDLTYGRSFSKFYASFRTRYQSQYVDVHSNVFGFNARKYSRNMFFLKYNINAYWGPYVALDTYYSLNNPAGNKLDRTLSFIGLIYKPNRNNQINLYYLIQKQVNVANPQTDFISGITYSYIF